MTPQERYKIAARTMAEHIKAQNAIEEQIHKLRKDLQVMKDAGWGLRQEYREAHAALLQDVAGDMLPPEFIPPVLIDHDRNPEE